MLDPSFNGFDLLLILVIAVITIATLASERNHR